MKLYLMRHGEALSPQVDPERGLTDNGKLNIKKVAEHLKQKAVCFEQVLHSEKKRARETAEIMTDILAPGLKARSHQHISPNDDPEIILTEIYGWDKDTLIASHLPFVPNLITALTGKDTYLSAITFETGTVVCLEKNGNDWLVSWSTAPSEL